MNMNNIPLECAEITVTTTRVVPQEQTKFASYTEKDWAIYFINFYGASELIDEKDKALKYAKAVLEGASVEIVEKSWVDGAISYEVSVK